MVAIGEEGRGLGGWVKKGESIKKYNLVVKNSHRDVSIAQGIESIILQKTMYSTR